MQTGNIGVTLTEARPVTQTPPEPTFTITVAQRPTIPMVADTTAAPLPQPTSAPVRYPLSIVLSRESWERWQFYKTRAGCAHDTTAFERLLWQVADL